MQCCLSGYEKGNFATPGIAGTKIVTHFKAEMEFKSNDLLANPYVANVCPQYGCKCVYNICGSEQTQELGATIVHHGQEKKKIEHDNRKLEL